MILKLNKNFFPCGITTWEEAFSDLYTGSLQFLDVSIDSDGNFDMFVLHDWESWCSREVEGLGSKFVHTPDLTLEIPIIVVSHYSGMPSLDPGPPSSQKIYMRDNRTCQYTGRKLIEKELSVDHVVPTIRCKQMGLPPNTWENMVTCERHLNSIKGNRLPNEVPERDLRAYGLKKLRLLNEPKKPKYRSIVKNSRPEWDKFLIK